ncbi:MAG: hypothetical protein C0436_00245 [Alphaproteobacteria bacterium]|nr:hypothetical protein [Alphaproteobacteria bacterium]
MKVTAEILIDPQVAYDVARRMRGLEHKPLTPIKWLSFLKSEHSPIHVATYRVYMQDIPAWVSVHLTRHKVGVEHFVTSRREDITGRARSVSDTVDHEMILNAQALITMARKRLCGKAHRETRHLMDGIKRAILELDAPMAEAMVADCVYRGRCYEMTPCRVSYDD